MNKKQLLKELYDKHFNIEKLMKDVFFDGFDTYEDYIKYGNMFIQLKPYTKTEYCEEIKCALDIYEQDS